MKTSHPARGEWIEIVDALTALMRDRESHPARGEWIEMSYSHSYGVVPPVSPREG